MKKEPLKDKKHSKSELDEKITIKEGWNPFGWYHGEDIKSAVEWLKEELKKEVSFCDETEGDRCMVIINEAFEDVTK